MSLKVVFEYISLAVILEILLATHHRIGDILIRKITFYTVIYLVKRKYLMLLKLCVYNTYAHKHRFSDMLILIFF